MQKRLKIFVSGFKFVCRAKRRAKAQAFFNDFGEQRIFSHKTSEPQKRLAHFVCTDISVYGAAII
jgi:hypothetical protein